MIPSMKMRLANYKDVIDVKKIKDLHGIKVSSKAVVIGAATKHADVANSKEVQKAIPSLSSLAARIGDAQVPSGVGKTNRLPFVQTAMFLYITRLLCKFAEIYWRRGAWTTSALFTGTCSYAKRILGLQRTRLACSSWDVCVRASWRNAYINSR